jgi:hypothetical protein
VSFVAPLAVTPLASRIGAQRWRLGIGEDRGSFGEGVGKEAADLGGDPALHMNHDTSSGSSISVAC